MRTFKALSTAALSACWAEILEESSLLQINNLKGDADADCFRKGRCGPATETTTTAQTTTTTTAETLLPSGMCTITGDPHIKTFDSKKNNLNIFYNGDYYLVKSQFVNIQARYWSTAASGKSTVKALAISGDIMEGRVLMIEPNVKKGKVLLDGQELTLAESGSMAIGTGTLTFKGEDLTLEFPDDDVVVKVARKTTLLNVIIEMRPERGQDGHCGNFNGDVADDDFGSVKTRGMATSLRFPETMFPIMEAVLQGCSAEAYGEEVGTYLSTHECNMMCSQRGSTMMANRDETCYCGSGAAPTLFQNGCKEACDDPAMVDPGFCVYEMAKPDPADPSTKCVLTEALVVRECAKAFTDATDQESCRIDICANGDLKGSLSYLSDWKAKEQRESKKLELRKQKEATMTPYQKKQYLAKQRAARARKRVATKEERGRKSAAAKVRKEKERSTKKMQAEKAQEEKKNKAAKAKQGKENQKAAEQNVAEREKKAADKKKAVAEQEAKTKKEAAEVAKKKQAAFDKKRAVAAEDAKKNQAAIAQKQKQNAEDAKKKQAAIAKKQAAAEKLQKKKKAEIAKNQAEKAKKKQLNEAKESKAKADRVKP